MFWITPTAIWECISWIPGFNGKTRRNKNDFFWRCHVWKITIFSQPRGGQKRHFFAHFFFSEYWFWSQVGASGVVYLSFFRIYGEKMIIFQHNDILRNFRIQTFLDFWIFWLKSLLRLFGSVFHGSQGSMAKCEEIRMIFFWKCHVWKITIFSQPRGGQKRHFFAQFFFSEYRFWSQVGASGVVYLSFFRIYGEKNDKFSSAMTY